MDKNILDKSGAAEMFGVSEAAISGWIVRRTIPYHKIGERIFFNRAELMGLVGGDPDSEKTDKVLEYLLNLVEKRRAELRA